MQAMRFDSQQVAAPPAAPPKANDSCHESRMIKVALAVIASLAAFVFLPLPAAFAITGLVTLGAIVCPCGSESPESLRTAPAQPVEESAPPALEDPTAIVVSRCEGDKGHKIHITFNTTQIRDEWLKQHAKEFRKISESSFRPSKTPTIWLLTKEGVSSEQIIRMLYQVFGENTVRPILSTPTCKAPFFAKEPIT